MQISTQNGRIHRFGYITVSNFAGYGVAERLGERLGERLAVI